MDRPGSRAFILQSLEISVDTDGTPGLIIADHMSTRDGLVVFANGDYNTEKRIIVAVPLDKVGVIREVELPEQYRESLDQWRKDHSIPNIISVGQ